MMYAPSDEKEEVYRDTRTRPHWYCVKTVLHGNGKIESEIIADEKTKLPIVIQTDEKPQDGVFDMPDGGVTYYNYHRGYSEAARQVEAARATALDTLLATV